MSRKVSGVIVALLLAAIGTTILVRYVQGAEDRALEGEELVEVYVIDDEVPAGTPAAELADYVRVTEVPSKVRADDAVADLEDIEELVAEVDLSPGEQLLGSRFVARQSFEARPLGLTIPEGLVEVTLALEPERAVGGLIAPGDSVAVFASFLPFDPTSSSKRNGTEPEGGAVALTTIEVDGSVIPLPADADGLIIPGTPNTTHILLHKVLVTSVQIERRPTIDEDDENNDGPALAPTGNLLVTLALDAPSAERLVFTKEFGLVWLGAEPLDAPEDGTEIQTRSSVYLDDPTGQLQ